MIETDRLLLRQWQDSDLDEWVLMNQDQKVMEFFPSTLTRDQAVQLADKIREHIEIHGWGLWAVEVKGIDPFIGFVGLSPQDLGFEWMPCVEIGWRLKHSAWGKGYATEAAQAALEFGIPRFGKIYSYTAASNTPSQKVMSKIGLVERPELAFEHPRVENPLLKPHVVFCSEARTA